MAGFGKGKSQVRREHFGGLAHDFLHDRDTSPL